MNSNISSTGGPLIVSTSGASYAETSAFEIQKDQESSYYQEAIKD